ncbi:hypothetical protein B0A49_13633 [Cryomyces minteri]|uniref:RNase H type-1 domain-containing protein n=1 Tax=Cryomyces minteri TaxID=331657 RepID=A0A4U0VM65_9PEZI|nr:hypothetical protein B0A49_13633 [Cryomyces minteri]
MLGGLAGLTDQTIPDHSDHCIKPLRQRLHDQSLRFWIGLHCLNKSHPHAKLRKRRQCKRFRSPLHTASTLFARLTLKDVEVIEPFTLQPWQQPPEVVILERDEAEEAATVRPLRTLDLWTGGSVGNGRAGVGVWARMGALSKAVRTAADTTVLLTELEAILAAASLPFPPTWPASSVLHVRIFSDSKSALRAISWARRAESQALVARITQCLQDKDVSLHWVSRHSKVPGNEAARELAKKATEIESATALQSVARPLSVVHREARKLCFQPKMNDSTSSKVGQYTRKIDRALPGKHTRKLYDKLAGVEASILAQLRTG